MFQNYQKKIAGAKALSRLPSGTCLIEFIYPARNEKISEQSLVSTNLRNQYMVEIPVFTDDVVLKITRKELGAKTIIP